MNARDLITFSIVLILGLGVGLLVRSSWSEPDTDAPPPAVSLEEEELALDFSATQVITIGNATCPIMGHETDEDSFSIVYNGMLVRFCCPGCDTRFLADPMKHLTAMREAGSNVPETFLDVARHPEVVEVENATSPVSGAKTDGSDHYLVHRGVRVELASAAEMVTFSTDPDRYLAIVAEKAPVPQDRLGAESAAGGSTTRDAVLAIGNEACPIMGNATDEDSFGIIYNGMLVRFCCPGCDGRFLTDPLPHLKAMREQGANIPEELLTADHHPQVIEAGNEVSPVSGAAIEDVEHYAVHRGVRIELATVHEIKTFALAPDRYLVLAAKGSNIPAERLEGLDR